MNEADKSAEEAYFRKHIFYVVLDNVIGELTVCFSAENRFLIPPALFGTTKNYQKRIEAQSS